MANDGQKEKPGDDISIGSGKHIDLNVEKDNCNKETRDQNPGEKAISQEGDVPKKADRGGYYNENNLQNNVMQPSFSLQDTSILVAKNNAQKGGGRKQPLQSPSTPGPRNTLTGLQGRSGEESQ
ncbi:hypothetical protein ACSBR2_005082 [Camellia fascicularis]